MNTQKFTAPTMREALDKVRESLGENAVILKSERVKAGGVLNFLRQDVIEVTAAESDALTQDGVNGLEFANSLQDAVDTGAEPKRFQRPPAEFNIVRDELASLRQDLSDIGKYVKYSRLPSMPRELAKVWENLGESGLNNEWVTDLTQAALIQLGAADLSSRERIEQYVVDVLAASACPAPRMTAKRNRPYKIMLMGLPGAGKTTLAQKLASDPVAYGKRRVGILSLDTHRMAAIDQMRAFARIAGTPFEVAYDPAQTMKAMASLANCEMVIIDTAGLSTTDNTRSAELAAVMSALDPDETHHVQNSMIRDEELIYANSAFRDLCITHLSFTRLDESKRNGFLLNIAREVAKPIAWLSTGQMFVGSLQRYTADHLKTWTLAPSGKAPHNQRAAMAESQKN